MVSELDAAIARPSSRSAASEFASELSTNTLRVANSDTDSKGGVPSVRVRGDRGRCQRGLEIADRGRITRPSPSPATEAATPEMLRVPRGAVGCTAWLYSGELGDVSCSTGADPRAAANPRVGAVSRSYDGKRPPSGIPARHYKWEPFQPGHELSMRHGAWSERRVAPLAARLVAEVVEGNSYLQDAAYASALQSWGRTEARIELVTTYMLEHGDLDGDGSVRPAADLLNRLEARAENLRARLGLDPLSRSRLGLNVSQTFDLAKHWHVEWEREQAEQCLPGCDGRGCRRGCQLGRTRQGRARIAAITSGLQIRSAFSGGACVPSQTRPLRLTQAQLTCRVQNEPA